MTIEFDPVSTPIMGRLQRDQQPAQEFEGMVELVSLLEAARRSSHGDSELSS